MTNREITHGEFANGARGTREYWIWSGMKDRCLNLGNHAYLDYGGRGITICPQWIKSYSTFLRDMGRAPTNKHSIDRWPNTNGPYAPDNCRWATRQEQADNRRITIRVAGMLVSEVAEATGVSYAGILQRHHQGWSEERIFSGLSEPSARKNARMITANGITRSDTEWGRLAGVKSGVISSRIDRGMSPEMAVLPGHLPPSGGNGDSKLTDDDVASILMSDEGARELADRLGVSRVRIYQIRRNGGKKNPPKIKALAIAVINI